MIANDPETLAAFLRASARGFADMKADPEETLAILLANQNEEETSRTPEHDCPAAAKSSESFTSRLCKKGSVLYFKNFAMEY